MPIQIPDLYDRNYDQLIKETESLVARYFPEYADIGPADPAVAFNELFVFLMEVALYQQNRITPGARSNFAALLGVEPVYGRPPEEALRLAHAKLSRTDRAITPGDIETIVKKTSLDEHTFSEPVRRVFVLPGKSASEPVQVFILQKKALEGITDKHRRDLRNLYACLRMRSPICTRYLIAHAPLLPVDVSAEIVKRRDSTIDADTLAGGVEEAIAAFIDPIIGGSAGDGWPFGKAVSRGDFYGLIEGTPGVDHVRSLLIRESGQADFGSADTLSPPEGGLLQFGKSAITVI